MIRALETLDDFRAVEDLQQKVWNVADREIVPALHFIPAVAVGAIVLGAFDGDRMVGFVYGFPGFEGEHRIIHSDMLAVLPEVRGRGLGLALKLAQRDAALAQGVDRITWTFDPLQARNAHLNFTRLGVTSERYLRDFYGETTSPLHRIGTDRLWVTWDLRSSRPAARSDLQIEIPRDVNALQVEEALQWRAKTREQFESAFSRGYIVTGFEGSSYILSSRA